MLRPGGRFCALWNTTSPKSIKLAGAGRSSITTFFSERCHPLGLINSVAISSFSRYFLSSVSRASSRRKASRMFICPSRTFSQVGVEESSQSAINTLAPELRALIIILRSVGPVISTRRSAISDGGEDTFQSPSRTSSVSSKKFGLEPDSKSACRTLRASSSSFRSSRNSRTRLAIKPVASGVKT